MTKKKEPRVLPEDATMLDELIERCYKQLIENMAGEIKLGDFLKMIEMRAKLTPGEAEQKKFWEMLDKIRAKTLAEKAPAKQTGQKAAKTGVTTRGKK